MLKRTQESVVSTKRKSLMSCQMCNRLASDGTTLHFFVLFFSVHVIQFSSVEPDIRTLFQKS